MNRKMNTNAREKRTLMKMVSRFEVKEVLLDKVNGGMSYHVSEDSNGNRYCKYCKAFKPAIYRGTDFGYEKGECYWCFVYKCVDCRDSTYWMQYKKDYYLD